MKIAVLVPHAIQMALTRVLMSLGHEIYLVKSVRSSFLSSLAITDELKQKLIEDATLETTWVHVYPQAHRALYAPMGPFDEDSTSLVKHLDSNYDILVLWPLQLNYPLLQEVKTCKIIIWLLCLPSLQWIACGMGPRLDEYQTHFHRSTNVYIGSLLEEELSMQTVMDRKLLTPVCVFDGSIAKYRWKGFHDGKLKVMYYGAVAKAEKLLPHIDVDLRIYGAEGVYTPQDDFYRTIQDDFDCFVEFDLPSLMRTTTLEAICIGIPVFFLKGSCLSGFIEVEGREAPFFQCNDLEDMASKLKVVRTIDRSVLEENIKATQSILWQFTDTWCKYQWWNVLQDILNERERAVDILPKGEEYDLFKLLAKDQIRQR